MSWFFVFIKNGRSRTISEEDEAEITKMIECGWEIVWDSARNKFEGNSFAAKKFRILPDDYSDDFNPIEIEKEIKLFRSVSIDELSDIIKRETIKGGGNIFNEFDRRKMVFFGKEINDQLKWHGNDIERLVIKKVVENDRMGEWFQNLIDERWEKLENLKNILKIRNREIDDELNIEIEKLKKNVEDFPFENNFIKYSGKKRIKEILNEIRLSTIKIIDVKKIYKNRIQNGIKEMKNTMKDFDYTSAIIETNPIKHGYRYDAVANRMGKDDEFGFFPESVLLEDVSGFKLLKGKDIVYSCDVDECKEVIEEYKNYMDAGTTKINNSI